MKRIRKSEHKYPKVVRINDQILGIKVSITSREEVLNFVSSRLDSKEKFYIVTPNPENLLKATKDWLLEKAIRKADLSVPDGIGLKYAYKFLKHKDLNIIKGRVLFLDLIKLANERSLRVYFFGGENGEQQKAIDVLKQKYPNVTFKTNFKFPYFDKNGQPTSKSDRKIHKDILGSIKMFEPDLIFVAMNTPKQEKWIFRNLYSFLHTTGAMSVGGTFNYIAGNMPYPPKWMENLGLEWFWRLIHEPFRIVRIINAVIIFPLTVIKWKISPPRDKRSVVKAK